MSTQTQYSINQLRRGYWCIVSRQRGVYRYVFGREKDIRHEWLRAQLAPDSDYLPYKQACAALEAAIRRSLNVPDLDLDQC